ncbi:response regulator transcription factor [Psychromonas hadalis]|uniref:response regulator transcription factor n=1 Tax=Psychromonas hadalis TaxID=211669 RepID=UPI0003B327C5|nr:response regulator transcription factor [Psychromonas hadalis]
MNKKILIVDDSEELTDALGEYLSQSGFIISIAFDGEQMKQILQKTEHDLIILDVNLPGDDGFTLCAHIRQRSEIPIIMLTAASDEVDRVTGLEIGADDYVTKDFSPRELLARIKAIFRRVKMQGKSHLVHHIPFSGWCLDTVSRLLISPQQVTIKLSGSDYSLLSLFLNNRNIVLSRDEIAQKIWGRDIEPLERGIDVQISRLRSHFNDKQHKMIVTVRNEGYVFADND